MAEKICSLKKSGGGQNVNPDMYMMSYTAANMTILHCKDGGHSKYTNTQNNLTVDGITFYKPTNFKANVDGTWHFTTQAVYNGEVITTIAHAVANTTPTFTGTLISPLLFIPD